MANVAPTVAYVTGDAAIGPPVPYPAITTRCDDAAAVELEEPLQPFLLREHRTTPLWIITRR
jgi:hypothetical protein